MSSFRARHLIRPSRRSISSTRAASETIWPVGSLSSCANEAFTQSQRRGQEDFGWYVTFRWEDTDYDFDLGYRPGENDKPDWMGTIERSAGFVGSILGARKRGIKAEALELIHTILSSSPQITDVWWFTDEDYKKEENGQTTPTAG